MAIFISFYCTLVIDYFLFRPEFDLYVFDHTYVFFVLGSLVAFGVGLADDFTGLRARRKLCFQIVAAGMAYTLVLDGRLPVGRRAEILLQAERATRQALLREPAEPRAWARLAWFLHIRQGAAVQFLAALRMSMYLAPADTDLAFWRIKMAGPCRADWDAGFEQMLTRQVILGWRVYLRVADRDMVALLDVGEVGPDYLPGHAHADTLSFEMSVFGQRVVVNSGTSCYGLGAERSRQRGTSAHSTVEVNGMDSSEVWGGFRVGRRARPFDVVVEETGRGVEVACSHDGYRRLPGQPVHRRQWCFGEGFVEISDRVDGGRYPAVARYHLHPAVAVDRVEGRQGRLLLSGNRTIRWQVVTGEADLVLSSYHPEFGQSLPCSCLEVRLSGMRATIIFSWG